MSVVLQDGREVAVGLGERFPVYRTRLTAEREPIDQYTRRLIYARDGHRCKHCGRQGELQLDHIIPWSAYGSDRSDNLRSLCGDCNEERSNFGDVYGVRVVGVTKACYWCTRPEEEDEDDEVPEGVERIRAYCGRCGLTSWVPSESWIL